MRKILSLVILTLLLSGCATYKFQRGREPYNKGYVVSRDGYIIPEYTVGEDDSVPKLDIARERFKKRKGMVEHYYKKMGYIENRFKQAFLDPIILFLKFTGGIFRLPSIAISDYKYEHEPEYKKRVIEMQEAREAREEARIKNLKDELNSYIQKEIVQEQPSG